MARLLGKLAKRDVSVRYGCCTLRSSIKHDGGNAEWHAALHFKATRLQARAVDAARRIGASNVMRR